MTVAHPATHGSIYVDRTYPIFQFPPRSPKTSIKYTTLRSNILSTLYFPALILSILPLDRPNFSNDEIISLSSTSDRLVWKRAKCLTHIFILHRIQTCICAIIFSTLSYWHILQATPEPVTSIDQCGLSCYSCLAKAPPGCSASLLTVVAFVSKALFDSIFWLQRKSPCTASSSYISVYFLSISVI